MSRTVVYPGSFDPITNGHLDVIERAAKLFDKVVVAVAVNVEKAPLFTVKERKAMVERAVRHLPHARVDSFSGLLVDYARHVKAAAVVRGLRMVSDFEYELQLALMNRRMEPRVETIFLAPRDTYIYLSSRMIKEIVRLDGDVNGLVPPFVEEALRRKLRRR
ncbi:MAG: pantetheine-phosphate adenylyltransferase [Verrucomicrobia bacterium]|nr:pantetheine-phosphate adenylyltransferase [Verrucomicrobiota bacterium]